MKRLAQVFLLAALLTAVAVGVPTEAQAQGYTWSRVLVDAGWDVGVHTSIALGIDGDPMVSYIDDTNDDLKFATCDLSASINGNCDQASDWSTVTVDPAVIGKFTSIAVGVNGNPMIAYQENPGWLKFATCDLSASVNGNCDQASDWTAAWVDMALGYSSDTGWDRSIAVDTSGNPLIAYYGVSPLSRRFAVCDLSTSTNGNCDQTSDWRTVIVDPETDEGFSMSIAVAANGDLMIIYQDYPNSELRFAVCDRAASTNGNCDQTSDWTTAAVDTGLNVGWSSSIAVGANGHPMISYLHGDQPKFAICDLPGSTNGNCDQPSDWGIVTVDSEGGFTHASMAVAANGDVMISYYRAHMQDLELAICDLSASTNGNCDQASDWSLQTVDSGGYLPGWNGDAGEYPSIAVGSTGDMMISYYAADPLPEQFEDPGLRFAIASPNTPPVGGIAEYPDVAEAALGTADASDGSSSPPYAALAGGLAAAALTLTATAWYARRRLG